MKRLLARLGTVLAAIALVLALSEVAIRVLDLGPTFQVVHREVFQLSDNPVLGYELRPSDGDGGTAINSAGFRDREYRVRKPAGVFRIVAIGDSVTFGPPEEREEAWPQHLERLLRADAGGGMAFEVLNLGVSGYNITRAVERLRVLGMEYDPDLVVYGYVLNDPQQMSIAGEALLDLERAAQERFAARAERGLARLVSRSRLYLLARHRFTEPAAPTRAEPFRHPVDPGYVALRGGDRRGDYFRLLHEEADGRSRLEEGMTALAGVAGDVPVTVAIFPLFLERGSQPDYPLAGVHRQVGELAASHGMRTVDLGPAYAAVATGFGPGRAVADFLHPSPFGYRVAAVALWAALDRSPLVPPDELDARILAALESGSR